MPGADQLITETRDRLELEIKNSLVGNPGIRTFAQLLVGFLDIENIDYARNAVNQADSKEENRAYINSRLDLQEQLVKWLSVTTIQQQGVNPYD